MSNSDEIKKKILNEGLRQWPNISGRAIGRTLGMSHTNVLYHFGGMDALKDAVATEAVRVGNSNVIVQLMFAGHPAVTLLTQNEREKHLASVAANGTFNSA